MRVITSNEHAKAIPGYLIDAFVSSLDGESIKSEVEVELQERPQGR